MYVVMELRDDEFDELPFLKLKVDGVKVGVEDLFMELKYHDVDKAWIN